MAVSGKLVSRRRDVPSDPRRDCQRRSGARQAGARLQRTEPSPLYQNELVRVLDIRIPPGHVTKYHVHANPYVAVSVQEARVSLQVLGEAAGPSSSRAPVPDWGDNWDDPLPQTHRVANLDTVPLHRIAAEWLRPAPRGCSSLMATRRFELLREGAFGRVYQIRLQPGQLTPWHTHSCPGLSVQGLKGSLLYLGTPPAAEGGSGAGHWIWRNADHRHVIRNRGTKPMTIIEIDWR